MNVLKKHNLPLVVLNSAEDNIGIPMQQVPKSFSMLTARKRRSYKTGRDIRYDEQSSTTMPTNGQFPNESSVKYLVA